MAKSSLQPLPQSDFKRYLITSVETEIDVLSWWASNVLNVVNYPATASLASQYLSVSAQIEPVTSL